MPTKSFILVISGVTGGGKTTLIQSLQQRFENSKVISFDDYSIDALPSAPPINTPVAEAINQYDITLLMNELRIVCGTAPLILIDFPFGRKHQVLVPYIDKAVYVQTPLDICFARQLLRDYQHQSAAEILNWTQTYLSFVRPIMIDHEQVVSADVDLIVDGTLPLVEQTALVAAAIENLEK